jgi:hypothetical protein
MQLIFWPSKNFIKPSRNPRLPCVQNTDPEDPLSCSRQNTVLLLKLEGCKIFQARDRCGLITRRRTHPKLIYKNAHKCSGASKWAWVVLNTRSRRSCWKQDQKNRGVHGIMQRAVVVSLFRRRNWCNFFWGDWWRVGGPDVIILFRQIG